MASRINLQKLHINLPGDFVFVDFDTIFEDFDTISSNPTAFKAEVMLSAHSSLMWLIRIENRRFLDDFRKSSEKHYCVGRRRHLGLKNSISR